MSKESALIDDLMEKYQVMPDDKKAEFDAFVDEKSKDRMWFPTIGPQLDAVKCLGTKFHGSKLL